MASSFIVLKLLPLPFIITTFFSLSLFPSKHLLSFLILGVLLSLVEFVSKNNPVCFHSRNYLLFYFQVFSPLLLSTFCFVLFFFCNPRGTILSSFQRTKLQFFWFFKEFFLLNFFLFFLSTSRPFLKFSKHKRRMRTRESFPQSSPRVKGCIFSSSHVWVVTIPLARNNLPYGAKEAS